MNSPEGPSQGPPSGPTTLGKSTSREANMKGTWATQAERWISGRVRRREITPMTARNLRSALSSFVDEIGNRTVIRPSDVERWIDSRRARSDATVRANLSAVRGWCAWLVEERILETDPTVRIRGPKEPRRLPRYIEAQDVAKVIEASPDTRTTAIVWLMFGAGLRCLEVSNLRIEDWDRQHDVIKVSGKGGHEREVPVVAEVKTSLLDYLGQHPASHGPLFRSYREPWKALAPDTISKYISKLMNEAGIKRAARDGVSAHALRHSCASDTLEASGGNLWLVSELLGHRNLATTQIYLRRARTGEMRDALDARFVGV